MRYKIFIILLGVFVYAPITHAQFSAAPDPLQFIVAPEAPGPNQLVAIEAQGVGAFLGNATVTWQVNGTTVRSGVGATTFSLTTGGVGTATREHVIINSTTNGTMTRDFVFSPSVVNLVWEARTTAPLFYKGKTLYSAGSTLKVVAYPTVASGRSLVSADKLSYQWSREGVLDPHSSGLGKSVFAFTGDEIQNGEQVSVEVYLGGSKVGHSEIFIPASDPSVIVYDRDPLRGELLDFALPASFNLSSKEVTLEAEPYFFAKNPAHNTLSYVWTLNGEETAGPESALGLLTLRQTSAGTGAADVGVSLQNVDPNFFTQAASQSLKILFGQSGGTSQTSLFGI